MKRVLHISTIHPRRDTRIFYRQCISLNKFNFKVYLIVADGKGDELIKGIQVLDLGKNKSRIENFLKTYFKILRKVKELKPDLVHFHDAELLIVGKVIQSKGVPVIYDIHENVSAQILDKKHISPLLRKPLHYIYNVIERMLINSFYLILAEDSYKSIYNSKGILREVILNLPEISAFDQFLLDERKDNGIFYIGGVSNLRGLNVIIKALNLLKENNVQFFMHFVGAISQEDKKNINIDTIKDNIKFYNRMDLMEGYNISKKCKIGLAILNPIKNYIDSYPTKIFEYMSIKLPVITSNFELYKNVVEKNECGFCIDPYSHQELAKKIEILLNNDHLVKKMGNNGRDIVEEKYNWQNEEKKLLSVYAEALRNEKY